MFILVYALIQMLVVGSFLFSFHPHSMWIPFLILLSIIIYLSTPDKGVTIRSQDLMLLVVD
jgi:hypothetical protein